MYAHISMMHAEVLLHDESYSKSVATVVTDMSCGVMLWHSKEHYPCCTRMRAGVDRN
jgi:hypothetical protein